MFTLILGDTLNFVILCYYSFDIFEDFVVSELIMVCYEVDMQILTDIKELNLGIKLRFYRLASLFD